MIIPLEFLTWDSFFTILSITLNSGTLYPICVTHRNTITCLSASMFVPDQIGSVMDREPSIPRGRSTWMPWPDTWYANACIIALVADLGALAVGPIITNGSHSVLYNNLSVPHSSLKVSQISLNDPQSSLHKLQSSPDESSLSCYPTALTALTALTNYRRALMYRYSVY
jgi:hypothetical protein